jgi:hypothetical protein
MTGSNDLDRLLGAYLDDGPRRAPDRAVDGAIAFARAHPRRRDPLGFLKPDVMARRHAIVSSQLAWAALVAVLTVGVVAAIGIGSRPNPAPVLPPPSVVATPAPTAEPSAPPPSAIPSASASPSPSSFGVVVTDENEILHPVEVVDLSGQLVAVEPGPVVTDDIGTDAVARNDVQVDEDIFVAWPYVGCDDVTTVTIGPAVATIDVERPVCDGDTLGGNPLQITLRFAIDVEVGEMTVQLTETP